MRRRLPSLRPSRRLPPLPRVRGALALALAATLITAHAQTPPAAAPGPAAAPVNSTLDAPLFYQLLIGEIELSAGQAGTAYEVVLDAARRSKDDALFRRAMEIALQARAGDQALAATRAWRSARPESIEAIRFQVQLLMLLNKPAEMAEPLRTWLGLTPVPERSGLIASLPRLLTRAADKPQAATQLEDLLVPYRNAAETRVAARVALGRMWLAAGDMVKALDYARSAAEADRSAPGPALLALDLLAQPGADDLVRGYLAGGGATPPEPAVRLAYARALTQGQRYPDAVAQLELATREQPQAAAPWLSLGALRLELKQFDGAEAALKQYLALLDKTAIAAPEVPAAAAAADGDADDDGLADGSPQASAAAVRVDNQTQAWLLLAQVAEQRGDLKAASAWLDKIDNPQRALEVQTRRASLLARQGNIADARLLIRRVPERTPEEARAKVLAEAQMLRDVKRWKEAADVLAAAVQKSPEDVDLVYEQAMIEDRLGRYGEMEKLLRRVIELKPDHSHAHNALGYSLADRNIRLPEARTLIQKALSLSPGDPFITDSLGWVEFRLGNIDEALRLLRQAFATRPDTEIAAHLGEVLWASGQQDEARRVWRDARGRDAANEVLRETLTRLRVHL